MARHPVLPEVGRIVQITRGRDSGKYAVVVSHAMGRFVYIADGAGRKVEAPKRKNALHLRLMPRMSDEFIVDFAAKQKVTNADLRHVMRQFTKAVENTGEGNQEGAMRDG